MKTNEVLETIKARRSVRAYDRKQIPADDLNAILEAGAYAPSGMHYETWHFTAVRNTVKLEELNERIKGAFAKSDDKHLRERGHSETYCCYYHAPTLVIVSNEPKQWWAGMDCACAIENMFLAATSLGIASCWINQLGTTCDDPEVRAYLTSLGVPENHKVYGCVALGYKGEFYQFNLSSCIRQQNSLTAQFVSFSLSNLANIFYPPIFTIINLCLL
ncbi:nitroreductase family protein [Bacteroides fragilis]|nr:nitroreductase family protein [Bacteroides fragilis]